MPPLPNVPNVLKVVVQGNGSEATPITWANVLHFHYSGSAPSGATLNTVAAHIGGSWDTHMVPECPSPTVQNIVEVIDLTSPTSASGFDFTSRPGTRGDDEIPANSAALAVYPVSRRYRGGHPRTYLLVGGNADFLDMAHWSTAFTAEVQSHWHDFLAGVIGFSTGGMTVDSLVNVSYYSKEENPVKPYRRATPVVDVLDISTMFVEQQIASQRRRIGRKRR